jgi:probable HAF family extracellular repeat protein
MQFNNSTSTKNDTNMKTKSRMLLASFTVIAGLVLLFTALALPGRLAAQHNQGANPKFHHYKLIDLGALGGSQSRIDFATPLNNHGTVSGAADTPNTNPYYGNDNPTFFPDPYIEHAFQWKNGILIDLGSLPGGGTSQPNCINKRGDVAGNASNNLIDPLGGWPESRAVLYKDNQVLDLGTLNSGNESAATCLNDQDIVIGFAGDNTPDRFSLVWGTRTHAFRWTRSQGMQDLGTLGGPDAIPITVNDVGQIAGFSYTNSTPNHTTGIPTLDPFLWENGRMIDLGSLGGTISVGDDGPDVNNRGQVVDQSNLAGDIYFHPYLWTRPGPIQDLGTLGGNYGDAKKITDSGEVVGWATNAGDQAVLAFLWKDGVMTNLGTVDGDPCSIALGIISSKLQIVGVSWDCTTFLHAFLWENGSIVDLNALVTPGAAAQLTYADYINERGEITVDGTLPNGAEHAFLLIPCDENHPGLEGCDYSLVEAPAAVPQPIPAIRGAISRTLPQSLMRRISRYHFPGRAFGRKN